MGILLQFRVKAITGRARLRAMIAAAPRIARERVGLNLVCWALRVLPRQSATREHLAALLHELRGYERNRAWFLLMGTAPISFEEWKAERRRAAWFARKMRSLA